MARMDRVSIRVDKKLRKIIKLWAVREGMPPAELCRRLLEWASDQYSHVGELATLRKTVVKARRKKTT